MTVPSTSVEVFGADEQSVVAVDVVRWVRLARIVLAEERVPGVAELSLIFVDQQSITDLNERFLGGTGPTDVLAFPMDDVLLYGLISKAANPDDYAVVGKYISVEPYGIMLRRDEPQFERIVNRALIDLFTSGEIRRIYAKWFNTRDLTVPLSPGIAEP